MVKLTLLELHVEDANLTANAPYSYGEKDVRASEDPPTEPESNSRKGAVLAVAIGLVFSMAIGYLVRNRLREETDTELPFDSDE